MAPKPSYHPPPGGPGGDLRGRLQQQQRPPATPPPSSSPRSMESFANDNITLIASNPTFGSTRGGGSYRTTNLLYSRGPTGPDAKAQRGGSPQPPFYAPPQRTNAALKSSYTPPTTSPGRRAGNTSNNSDSMAALLAGKAPPPANSNKRGPGGAGGRPHPASGPTNLQRGGLGPEAASSPLYGSSSNVSARASSTGALGGVSGLSLHEPTPEAEDSFGRTQFLSSVRQASGLDGSIGGAGDSHRPFALAGGTDGGAAATRGGGAFPRHSTSSNVSSSSTARTGSKKAAGAAKTAPVPPQAYDFRVVLSSGKTNGLPITLSVGSGCVQGIRPTMEDEHFAKLNHAMVREQPVSLLAVLDGHCGRRVADLGAKWLPEYFFSHDALGDNNALSLMESILQTDRAIYRQLSKGAGGGVGAVFGGNDYGMNQDISGGSTLITAAIHGRMLYVACLGDARAVLYDGRSTIAMSEDHKPIHPKESRRIAKCGGFVQFGRVCGVLAVSRALGDFEFKVSGANRGAFGGAASNKDRFSTSGELMVSNVADVRQLHLTDDSIFLVLACDGLWDVVSNEDATQFVKDFLLYTPDINDPLVLCGKRPKPNQAIITRALNNCSQKLAEFAVDRGSTDNVSTMVLFFHDVIDSVASFNEAAGLDNMEGADSPSSNRHRAGAGGAHRGEGSHGIYSPSHQGGRRNVAAGGTGHLSPQKGGYNFDASPMKHNTNSPRARQHQQPVLSSPRGGKRRPSEVLSGSFNRGMEYTTPTPTQKGVPNWTGRSRPLW